MGKISIYSNTADKEFISGTSEALPTIKRASQAVTELSSEVFSKNLGEQLSAIKKALSESTEAHGLQVENVKVKFVVDAKGGVHLFGELSAGLSASIEVQLKP